jgi:16S rRNA (adenine1518-N6/adenine1519-N6)-dimethyltransferase
MTSGMAALDQLPPLREVIARHGLSARKALGQNFLLDLNLTRRIARAGGPLAGARIIEVGPGPGGLTRALLLEGAAEVVVIERDPRALPALDEIAQAAGDRLRIIEGDALAVDYPSLAGPNGARVVANLPYNIATPLLAGWLLSPHWPPWWDSLTLMFQREVAQRIAARPGEKAYGRLSVLAGWRASARLLFDVPGRAFTPPPKVTSSIVRLEPRPVAAEVPPRALETVTVSAFGQRRKMLRSSLRALWREPEPIIIAAGLDPAQRAETVPIEGFIRLARIYDEEHGASAETG